MSLMNCATSSENKTLSVVDIRAIIETCGENGVKEIAYGNLNISFHSVEIPISTSEKVTLPEETKATEESIIETAKNYERSLDLERKAEELMNLHLSDPLKYEEILANPELTSEFEEELDREL